MNPIYPHLRWSAALVALPGLLLTPSSLRAQTPPLAAVQRAIAHQNLREALAEARAAATAAPDNAMTQQVLGILLVANGKIPEAEQAFATAVAKGPDTPPADTGLEAFYYPGSALYETLDLQKVTLALDAGAASARNNLGAVRAVRGQLSKALDDLNAAGGARPDWGLPAANEAVLWLEQSDAEQAIEAAQEALDQGEGTAKVYTSLADAYIRQQRWDDAKQALRESEARDPDYPYGLLVQARYFRLRQMPRDAERALFQALTLNPSVAADNRRFENTEVGISGGNQDEDHQRFLREDQPSALSYQGLFERDRGDVENRANAYQRRDFTEPILGFSGLLADTALYGGFLQESGGRPGPLGASTPMPNAWFDFNRTDVAVMQRLDAGGPSRLLLRAVYRHNGVLARFDPSTPVFRPLRDEQMGLEGRFDTTFGSGLQLRAGFGWLQNRRDAQVPAGVVAAADSPGRLVARGRAIGVGTNVLTPIEPNEQVFDVGTTTLLSGYMFVQGRPMRQLSIALGPVVATHNGAAFAMPYAEAQWQPTSRQSLRASIRPRLMNANTDLYPLAALAEMPQDNTLDSRRNDTAEYNRDPLLFGATGRALSYEIEASSFGRNGSALAVTAFHRRFYAMFTVDQDPRLAPVLALTSLSQAEMTGIEVLYRQPLLLRGLSVTLFGRVQRTHFSNPPSSGGGHGTIAEIPEYEVDLNVIYAPRGGWQFGVQIPIVGPREVNTTPSTQQISTRMPVSGSAIASFFIERQVSDRFGLFFDIYNAAKDGLASYYPGFPNRTAVLGGVQLSF